MLSKLSVSGTSPNASSSGKTKLKMGWMNWPAVRPLPVVIVPVERRKPTCCVAGVMRVLPKRNMARPRGAT